MDFLRRRHRARRPVLGPAADDVTHRQDPAELPAVDDDEMADAPPDHLLSGPFETPVRGGGYDAVGHVVGDLLGIEIVAIADRQQDVALGNDARRRGIVVIDERRTRPLLSHLLGRLAKGMRGANGKDDAGHSLADFHLVLNYRMGVPNMPLKRPQVLLSFAAAFAVLAVSGCEFQSTADEGRGRMLFVQKCGTCHSLDAAGTQSTVGPDLDAAFFQSRKQGMDSDTFEGVIKSQVENPRPSTDDPSVSMPADIVTGQDLDDVAAYVASVAGVPGIKPPAAPGGPGGQVFATNGCGSCHTMQAAGASGTLGPNLDESLKGQSAAQVTQSILDPGAKLAKGYPNAMPDSFDGIPKDQLRILVAFLLKGGKG